MLPVIVRNKSKPWIVDKVPLNNRVSSLGDSLTQCGAWLNFNIAINCGSYMLPALTLPKTGDTISQGRFIPGGDFGVTGAWLDYIIENLLPQVFTLNPLPGICLVLAGTNDLATMTDAAGFDAAAAKLEYMYRALLSYRILPIAQGIPTCANATNRSRIPTFNQHISDLATQLGIPYIDYYPLTDNGVDGWIAGYSSDSNVHWSTLGAGVCAQALRDNVLESYISLFSAPNLVSDGNDSGNGILYENGSMMDDANSDGIPDAGSAGNQVSNYWYVYTGGADTTFSLVAEPGVVSGKWWRINKSVHTANLYVYSQQNPGISVTPNAVVEIGFMCKVLNPQFATTIEIVFYHVISGQPVISLYLNNLNGDVKPFKCFKRGNLQDYINGIVGFVKINDGTVDLYLGQLTIREVG
jgi:lysophospholipase L1-like esterase